MINLIRDALFLPLASSVVWSNYANPNLSPTDFPHIYGSLLSYYATDLLFSHLRPDCVIHHSIALFFIGHDLIVPFDTAFRTVVANVEIPSILMTMLPYLWNPVQAPAKLLYVCLFIKTRLIDVYPFLTFEATLLNGVLWCFYVLNMYWVVVICRKLSKPFIGGRNLLHVAHTVCAFTFASSFVFHASNETPFQMVAHCALAIASFNVHWFHQKRVVVWWIADIVSMHLVCISNQIVVNPGYRTISFTMHAGVVATRTYFIDEYTRPLSLLPFMFDGVVTMRHFSEKTQIAVIVYGLYIVLVEKINPFYDLSFIAVHALIIWCMHIYLMAELCLFH